MKKLAEALLRRKELQMKIDRIEPILKGISQLFETRVNRVKVTDSIDDLTVSVPKLELNQVTAEFDYYAQKLRLIDAAIQQTNWTADVEGVDECFKDFKSEK